jgi:hypothetical protein
MGNPFLLLLLAASSDSAESCSSESTSDVCLLQLRGTDSDNLVEKTADAEVSSCEAGEWTEWTACSVTCGYGSKMRTRHVNPVFVEGSVMPECPYTYSDTTCDDLPDCEDEDELPDPSTSYCIGSDWSEWTECSASCGAGTKYHTREILHYNRPPGTERAECPLTGEEVECNLGECPGQDAITPTSVGCDEFEKRKKCKRLSHGTPLDPGKNKSPWNKARCLYACAEDFMGPGCCYYKHEDNANKWDRECIFVPFNGKKSTAVLNDATGTGSGSKFGAMCGVGENR